MSFLLFYGKKLCPLNDLFYYLHVNPFPIKCNDLRLNIFDGYLSVKIGLIFPLILIT